MTDSTDTTEPAQPTDPTALAHQSDDVWAVPTDVLAAEGARKPRRAGLLRWGAAVLILLLSGTAAAVAVATPERTRIPGLETPNDGRYAFPHLTLPPLPSGKPKPSDTAARERHFADLRELLLPAPKGATVLAASPVATASPSATATATATPTGTPTPKPTVTPAAATPTADWVGCTDYAADDKDTQTFTALLTENACRAATKRIWTAADGTRTEIWLLHFGSSDEADAFNVKMPTGDLKAVPGLRRADLSIDPSVDGKSSVAFTDRTAGGKGLPVGRVAYLVDGDIAAAIVMTNPQGVPLQAFRQVTILQNDLLR